MILVLLMGGLGNQMFQYAAAKKLALLHDTSVKLDPSFLKEAKVLTKRDFELHNLSIMAEIATKEELGAYTKPPKRFRDRLLALFSKKGSGNYFSEPGFHYFPAFLDLPDNTYLDGYWQSYRYLEGIESVLRSEFTTSTVPDDWNASMLRRIAECEAVAVHIRRGDYVSCQMASSYHGTCSLDYYREALQLIQQKVSAPRFFVFSDEPEWVKENLVLPEGTTFMDHNGANAACEDLRLMSQCRHFIIANSSFSWWGAWLGDASEKIVVAPQKWFSAANVMTDDLIPPGWIRL